MEHRFAVCVGRISAFALVALFLLTAASVAQPNLQGQWTTLSYTMPINPVHVALLRTGKVLVVSGSGNVAGNTNYQAAIWDPQANTITTKPVAWDIVLQRHGRIGGWAALHHGWNAAIRSVSW